MIVQVNVTEEDVRGGMRGICQLCPIALAIKRLVKEKVRVYISDLYVTFFEDDLVPQQRLLSQEAIDFVFAFDNVKEAFPFSFKVDIPQIFLKGCSHG